MSLAEKIEILRLRAKSYEKTFSILDKGSPLYNDYFIRYMEIMQAIQVLTDDDYAHTLENIIIVGLSA